VSGVQPQANHPDEVGPEVLALARGTARTLIVESPGLFRGTRLPPRDINKHHRHAGVTATPVEAIRHTHTHTHTHGHVHLIILIASGLETIHWPSELFYLASS
jgi:hypothetical protein